MKTLLLMMLLSVAPGCGAIVSTAATAATTAVGLSFQAAHQSQRLAFEQIHGSVKIAHAGIDLIDHAGDAAHKARLRRLAEDRLAAADARP